MKRLALCFVGVLGLLLSSQGFSASVCHEYILKVTKQLDLCGQNQACLNAPFNHALNMKNYGTKYIDCKNTFKAEVADRLAAVPMPSLEELEAKYAKGASCSNAFYFLTYATKSCTSSQCVDQQYLNTIKIPAFQYCSGSLLGLREARKASLKYGYQYANWNYNAMDELKTAENQ